MRAHEHACETARQLLSCRLDGELTEWEARRLSRHLSTCDACAAFGRRMGAIAETLRDEPLVAHRIALPNAARAGRRRAARVLQGRGAAAAAVLAVGLGSVTVAGLLAERGDGLGGSDAPAAGTTVPVGSDALFVPGRKAPLPIGQRNASEDFRSA